MKNINVNSIELNNDDIILEEKLKKNYEYSEQLNDPILLESDELLLRNATEETINELYFKIKLKDYENEAEKKSHNKKLDDLLIKISEQDKLINEMQIKENNFMKEDENL